MYYNWKWEYAEIETQGRYLGLNMCSSNSRRKQTIIRKEEE